MDFFNSAVEVLQTLVVALGAGLGVWGVINLLEGIDSSPLFPCNKEKTMYYSLLNGIIKID